MSQISNHFFLAMHTLFTCTDLISSQVTDVPAKHLRVKHEVKAEPHKYQSWVRKNSEASSYQCTPVFTICTTLMFATFQMILMPPSR
jgi:hypothetical protein